MENCNCNVFNFLFFDKYAINNIAILHDWKESKDVDRMMKQNEHKCQN
jgi:hypothetical protein